MLYGVQPGTALNLWTNPILEHAFPKTGKTHRAVRPCRVHPRGLIAKAPHLFTKRRAFRAVPDSLKLL